MPEEALHIWKNRAIAAHRNINAMTYNADPTFFKFAIKEVKAVENEIKRKLLLGEIRFPSDSLPL